MIADIGTERAVVGGVLVHPKAFSECSGLRPEHFTRDELRAAWAAIAALDAEGKPVDALAVSARSSVPVDALAQLMAEVVTVENMAYHARRLTLAQQRREIEVVLHRLMAKARDAAIEHEEFVEEAQREMLAAATVSEHGGGPMHVRPILREVDKLLLQRHERKGISGITSGSPALDEMTDGLQPEDLVILAARPSMGKTARALRVVSHCAKGNVPSLVFSLEMSRRALLQRLVSSEAGVSKSALRRGTLSQTDWVSYSRGVSKMSEWPVWIDDRGGLDVHEIRATARRWHARLVSDRCRSCAERDEPCIHRVVVVDHMSLIKPPRQAQHNREREVALASMTLKQMSKELKVATILLCQLNRGLEARADKRPMMSDLRESGAIEQDADIVAFIYRPVVYDANADPKESELIVAKQRDGATGTLKERWLAETQMFVDA